MQKKELIDRAFDELKIKQIVQDKFKEYLNVIEKAAKDDGIELLENLTERYSPIVDQLSDTFINHSKEKILEYELDLDEIKFIVNIILEHPKLANVIYKYCNFTGVGISIMGDELRHYIIKGLCSDALTAEYILDRLKVPYIDKNELN